MRRPFARLSATLRGVVGMLVGVLAAIIPDRSAAQLEDGLRDRLPRMSPAEAESAVRHWTVADGLPGQRITALAQTPDGYLWCGTDDALVRWDGSRFRTFFADELPEMEGHGVSHLSCDGEGRLWIWWGTGSLVVLEDGRFRKMGVEDGMEGKLARPDVTGRGGDHWFVSEPGEVLHRYREGRFERHSQPLAPGASEMEEGMVQRLSKVWADEEGPRWAIVDRLQLRGDQRSK